MTPWPGDIAEVWQAVDIHAHPSLLDSSPIAIHESMALGLPAVVSSAGGIPELVEHDVTGLVVPTDDSPHWRPASCASSPSPIGAAPRTSGPAAAIWRDIGPSR